MYTIQVQLQMVDKVYEDKLNQHFDHGRLGLKPKHRATAQHATINDDLPNRIACGSVIVSEIKPINIITESGKLIRKKWLVIKLNGKFDG